MYTCTYHPSNHSARATTTPSSNDPRTEPTTNPAVPTTNTAKPTTKPASTKPTTNPTKPSSNPSTGNTTSAPSMDYPTGIPTTNLSISPKHQSTYSYTRLVSLSGHHPHY
jgi:hypothetical protein